MKRKLVKGQVLKAAARNRILTVALVISSSLLLAAVCLLAIHLGKVAGLLPRSYSGSIVSVEEKENVRILTVQCRDGKAIRVSTSNERVFSCKHRSSKKRVLVAASMLVPGMRLSVVCHTWGSEPYNLSAIGVIE